MNGSWNKVLWEKDIEHLSQTCIGGDVRVDLRSSRTKVLEVSGMDNSMKVSKALGVETGSAGGPRSANEEMILETRS